MNNKSNVRAFTLIELITVIGIIGVLASVVLVLVGNARESGRMAANFQFEANILHGIGDQMVLELNFDENSGSNVAYDTSSYSNNGNITGPANRVVGVRKNALDSTYTTQTVIPSSTSLNIYKNSFTASIWTKTVDAGDMKVFRIGADAELNYYHGYLRSCFNGCENVNQTVVTDNKWHHVAVIGDTSSIRMYFDGKLKSVENLPASNALMSGGVQIGTGGAYNFVGQIDAFRLYSTPLNVAQIDQLYAEGLKTHQDLAVK